MTQTPAGWFTDPQDPTQYRYWDGAQWTEHRSPRTTAGPAAPQAQPLVSAGQDIADGIAGAFTSFGSWVQQNVATASPSQPTFHSVASACRDEPARQPLSHRLDLVLRPSDVEGVRALFAATRTAITPEGAELPSEVCRLVPNPWNPADPTGVAVFVGAIMVGALPPDVAPLYSPALTALTQKQLLATGTAQVWAQGPGVPSSARVSIAIPETIAFDSH